MRRGGHHQRRTARDAGMTMAESSAESKSSLADYLIERFAWGYYSAVEVQRLAALTVADFERMGARPPQKLEQLAGLGAAGTWTRNCHRDMMRQIVTPVMKVQAVVPCVVELQLGFKMNRFGRRVPTGVGPVDFAIVAPHVFAAEMYEKRPKAFHKLVLGCDPSVNVGDHLAAWWSCVSPRDPRLNHLIKEYMEWGRRYYVFHTSHVMLKGLHYVMVVRMSHLKIPGIVGSRDEFHRRVIPIALHGDGVPCTQRMSLDTITWTSCLVQGNPNLQSFDVKFYIAGMLNRVVASGTLKDVWSVVYWSLLALARGKHPLRDWNGHELQPELAARRDDDLCGGLVAAMR